MLSSFVQPSRAWVLWAVLLAPCTALADLPTAVVDLLDNNRFETLADPRISDVPLAADDAGASADAVWQAYRREQIQSPKLAEAERLQVVRHGDIAMRYAVSTIGQPGPRGYPLYIALHGGGTAPPYVNDGQWEHMKVYYKSSIQNGVYVAPRAISDTWDMHFQQNSYHLYKGLIAQMILSHQVDPDRVYLLGFSAGGDGVYQVAPRISDRLAAASMSAGHPNGVSLLNLQHVPMLLQVGEQDNAYQRNRVTARFDAYLGELHAAYPTGYIHETFIHAGKGHNFYDNDPREIPQAVMNPQAWLDNGTRDIASRNTNAVAWLNQFTRSPLPHELTWDLTTVAPIDTGDAPRQHHWLDIGHHTAESLGTQLLHARVDTERNTVTIEGAKTYLKVWVNHTLLDLQRPVRVVLQNETKSLSLTANLKHQVQSVLTHGDPRRVYDAAIELNQSPEGWEALAP